jgi:hypothetical protein
VVLRSIEFRLVASRNVVDARVPSRAHSSDLPGRRYRGF